MDRFEKILFSALAEVLDKVWSDQIAATNAAEKAANVAEYVTK
jgi:hypothetical protein